MATPETSAIFKGSVASPGQPNRLPLVTLHDLLWLLYLYPLRVLARALPRPILYAVGRAVDPIIQFHVRRGRAKAVTWIRKACGASGEQAERIARRSLTNKLFRLIDELLLLSPSAAGKIRCAGIEGPENLERAIAEGKGVILLVGHFCATRIGIRYLAMYGRPALFVRNQQPPNRRQGQFGRKVLTPRFVALQKLAYPDQAFIQDPDCSLSILRRLRSGGLVIIQMDGGGGTRPIEGTFLGRRWHVPSGIFEVVRFTRCAVVPMLCLGRSDRLQIHFRPKLDVEEASSREEFVSRNLHRFQACVQEQVMSNPEEWTLWNHWP